MVVGQLHIVGGGRKAVRFFSLRRGRPYQTIRRGSREAVRFFSCGGSVPTKQSVETAERLSVFFPAADALSGVPTNDTEIIT